MKTTFWLPDALLDELRRRSEEEGRSPDSTAIDVLRRGLGQDEVDDGVSRVLGSFIVRSPTKAFDAEALARRLAGTQHAARGLLEVLEWVREDRF